MDVAGSRAAHVLGMRPVYIAVGHERRTTNLGWIEKTIFRRVGAFSHQVLEKFHFSGPPSA